MHNNRITTNFNAQSHYNAVIKEQESEKNKALNIFQETLINDLKQKGVNASASMMNQKAGNVLKGYAKIFEFIDSPIATLMATLLEYIGVQPNVFIAAQQLLQSDSIGLDPHEKLGIPVWKYQIIEEIQSLMKELSHLEAKATFSKKFERKKEIEIEIMEKLKELQNK